MIKLIIELSANHCCLCFPISIKLAFQLLESIGTTLASVFPDNNNQQELIPVSLKIQLMDYFSQF